MKTTLLLLILVLRLASSTVTHYQEKLFCYGNQANLRSFLLDGKPMQLSVDTQTLQTSIHSPVKTIGDPCNDSRTGRYGQLLNASAAAPHPLQNDGITSTHGNTVATTDLCPSTKHGFEQALYEAMIRKFFSPVPVTLFITGRWIKKHPRAFMQFLAWEKEGKLVITWGNHTYNHPYHSKVPLKENFALSKGYDLKRDTLKLEKLLISRGVTPSLFFRFPGLVSDQKSIQTIRDLGLITIGSNTWIAKGQKIKGDSIILLHGNKNEPKGVKIFLEQLQKKKIPPLHPLTDL